ncbi:MAG: ornithine carbamoyltransferase [Nitrososphaerota archaeon]
MRHFLQIFDATRSELLEILERAASYKKDGYREKTLQGRVVALLFEKPSTRTRVSFSSAVSRLGGEIIYLPASELQLARGEPIKDTARVLSRYVDAAVARLNSHSSIEELARYSSIPVVNALTDLHHPCQALADLATMYEFSGGWGFKVAYIGDFNNVCRSLVQICVMLGVSISVAVPKKYWPPAPELAKYRELAASIGSELEVLEDPESAVKDADFVYTDVLVSMGLEAEYEKRLKDFLPRYRVTMQLLKNAKPGARFMHCMPIKRGEEVDEEVVESPLSIIFDQAEYRMHTSAALLTLLLTRG